MHDARIERLIHLNVTAPIILTKYVVRAMMADGGGRIVNVSSIVGFTGFKGLAAYAATKSSIIGFTRSLAREVGSLGITVNAIAPGFIDTEMTEGLDAKHRGQIAAAQRAWAAWPNLLTSPERLNFCSVLAPAISPVPS